MSRSSQFGRCLFLLSALTAAALWLASAPAGHAAAYTYAARQRTVNAGVLFVGSAADAVGSGNATDPAPYIFHVLNLRADVKPVGWSLINPIAPSQVTNAIVSRWRGIAPGYNLGDQLTPNMAAYWEVPLRDVSAGQLQQFDVLYLHAASNGYQAQFTPADNEKLRRFVDNGGQLLVEYGGGASATYPLFADVGWTTAGNPNVTFLPPTSPITLSPLVSQPYPLGVADLRQPFLLGTANDTNIYGTLNPSGASFLNGEFANLFGAALYRSSVAAPLAAVPTLPGVVAGPLGAGQITVSALDIGPNISSLSSPTAAVREYFSTPLAPYNPDAAPLAGLKFLSNVIAYADSHPTENKTSHQNAAGPSAASFAPAWSYPDPALNTPLAGTVTPPAAAIWGSFVFVTDSTGMLSAFDAYPDGDLLGRGQADDQGGTPPKPYGLLWQVNVGVGASAPTVGSYGGSTYVFVETPTGSVLQFNAAGVVTSTLVNTFTPSPATGTFGGVNAPAPTYYEGRIYAGQPDGSLFVASLNGAGSAGGGVTFPLNPAASAGSGEYVTASPAVGLLASGDTSDTLVAYVPTTQNLYTVLLGGRNDPLIGFTANGALTGYNVNRSGRFGLINLFVDPASLPLAHAYDGGGNNVLPITGGQDPVFGSIGADLGTLYADWDADLKESTSPNGQASGLTLTLHSIKAQSIGAATPASGSIPPVISAPAIDRSGDYYYTVNDTAAGLSYLFGVHDDIVQGRVRLKFRFRIPTSGDLGTWNGVDADNVNYNDTTPNKNTNASNSLVGFAFVGAPVVDGQGNVYVAAQNSGVAAVLCFNANQDVTADGSTTFDGSTSSYTQADESGGQPNSIIAVPPNSPAAANGARYGQITTSVGSPHIDIFNFGRGTGGARQIAGNVSEPQPIVATASDGTGTFSLPLHTNLAWYVTFPVNGAVSGLSKTGSTLMLVDSGASGSPGSPNVLYKLPAAPTVGAGRVATVTPVQTTLGTGLNGTGLSGLSIGTVAAAPSAGGGAMVVNGRGGIAALTQQLTLIADGNRILETDADGNAVWSADATTRDAGLTAAGATISTKVDFAHPTWLSPFAANDYLVADTGNNRCVRFNRAGKVVWELTRFYDPGSLMAPGQPTTLNQPASVEVRREPFAYTLNGNNFVGTNVHYLVADAGNDRIVEVTDTLDSSGNILHFDPATGAVINPATTPYITQDHLLTWVTHTGDKYGRHYHYGAASYLDIPSPAAGTPDTLNVLALVTNSRLGSLTPAGQPASASADGPGGSIVAFLRPTLTAPKAFNALTPADNDLVYVATTFTAQGGQTPFLVRNPRYLHVFAPPQPAPANPSLYKYSFLYADDNGAFDLNFTGQTTPPASYGLAFTTARYQAMTLPTNNLPLTPSASAPQATTAFPDRTRLPFLPSCVQRLNDDDTNVLGAPSIQRYLITQSFGHGEIGTRFSPPTGGGLPPPKIGGEVFEVDVTTTGSGAGATITMVPVGGFAGGITPLTATPPGVVVGTTLSRPVGASPLVQPASAIRTAQ